MMDLMEFPQERYAVREIVIEPVAELVGQEQQDRDRGAIDIGRQRLTAQIAKIGNASRK
jgi:hypothetical protein